MNRNSDEFSELRRTIHRQMGGTDKVRALRIAGRRTARDVIDALCDAGSFTEIGTFAGMHAGAPATAAGDGRITGQATIAGHPIGIIVDDITVKRASSTAVNARKAERVVHIAKQTGTPLLFIGEAGGARLPETLRGENFASEPIYPWLLDDDRPALIAAIVGDSYGGSSFVAALADVCVMLRGAVMALTSPAVVAMATGAQVTADQLGGADVLASKTDVVDVVVDDSAELDRVLKALVGMFADPRAPLVKTNANRPAAEIVDLVAADHSVAYDVRPVIGAIVDVDSFIELGASRGRSVVTGLARIDGHVVGIVASQPAHEAGAMSPTACQKIERLTRLCDRHSIPMVALVDTPGFQIGVDVEHAGMLRRSMELIQVNTSAHCPVITVILRKAFGLAFFAMFSPDHGGDVVLAWPDARIGFMDPMTAASVLHGEAVAGLTADQRRQRLADHATALGATNRAIDVAAAMGIDEIIDPPDTVSTIRRYLNLLTTR